MILSHNKLAIFSFPRAGTKLIANILGDFGYHSYGEWYDTWSSEILNDTAKRLPASIIAEVQQKALDKDTTSLNHLCKTINRHKLMTLSPKYEKTVVTVWYESISVFPMIIDQLIDCFWLLPKRNKWDQLLSWIISFKNQNFNGQFLSNPIIVNKRLFDYFSWKIGRAHV